LLARVTISCENQVVTVTSTVGKYSSIKTIQVPYLKGIYSFFTQEVLGPPGIIISQECIKGRLNHASGESRINDTSA